MVRHRSKHQIHERKSEPTREGKAASRKMMQVAFWRGMGPLKIKVKGEEGCLVHDSMHVTRFSEQSIAPTYFS